MKNRKMILTLIILLTIGFASVSTTLVLNGVIGIASNESDFEIIFTSARLDGRKRNDLIGETKKTINFETNKLTKLDEEAVLDYEVTNTSRLYDADVVISCNIVDEEENIIESNDHIVISYEPKSMTVKSGMTESGSITVRLFRVSTEDQSIKIKCTLNANATERDELGEEYIVDKGLMIPVNRVEKENGVTEAKGAFWDYKENITKVVFEDKTNDRTNATYTFDVSQNQDESVMSYLVANEDDSTKYTLYIQSEDKVILNPISHLFFDSFVLLEEIKGLDRLDTSNVTTMYCFFWGCGKLKSLDINSFDTSSVTNMNQMFSRCTSLTSLDLSNFDTSQVADMAYMFENCSSLTSLNISNFDTRNVENMNGMFQKCSSLKILNLNNFSTPSLIEFGWVFKNCSSLEKIDISNIDTRNVTMMTELFNGCNELTELDLSGIYTSNVTDMHNMFKNCTNLKKIDISNFDTSKVTSMYSMFENCSSLLELDLNHFDTSSVSLMYRMFCDCVNLVKLNINEWDTSEVTNMGTMFCGCSSLASLDISNFDTSKVNYIDTMFRGCSSLTSLDLSNFNISNVENMEHIFHDCVSLTHLDIRNFTFEQVTTAVNMFYAMPDNAIVIVKDAATQNKVLNSLPTINPYPVRPSSWTTDNVITAS